MAFPILSALAELVGAYARYCGRRLMRKLGGFGAAERRRVLRRAAVDKRAVADKREAVAEIKDGKTTFFSKEEEAEIEAHNAAF